MFRERVAGPVPPVDRVRVTRAASLAQVGPDDWERVSVHAGLYSSRQWLLALEGQPGFDASYLLARAPDGRLVGALPLYRVASPGSVSLYDHYALFVAPWAGETDRRSSWFPAVYAGTKAGYQNALLVDPELEASAAREVLLALLAELAAIADGARARSLAWLYLTEASASAVLPLLGAGVRPLLSAAATHVAVRWGTFDDYLASLAARRRWSVRSEIDRFSRSGHQVSVGRLSDCWSEAGPLLANVQRKYGHGSTPEEMTAQLARQAETMDAQSVVFQCRSGSRLVAYALCFAWGDELYLRTVGFDYGATGAHAEYFSLGCYLPIRYAIEHGLRIVHLGVGSYEAKLRRGAVPSPLWSALVPARPEPGWERWQAGWNAAQLERLLGQFGGLTDPLPMDRWLGMKKGALP